ATRREAHRGTEDGGVRDRVRRDQEDRRAQRGLAPRHAGRRRDRDHDRARLPQEDRDPRTHEPRHARGADHDDAARLHHARDVDRGVDGDHDRPPHPPPPRRGERRGDRRRLDRRPREVPDAGAELPDQVPDRVHLRRALTPELGQARWWATRPAQSSKPATYRCPFCGGRLHAMSAHTLIAPEGDAERRRHAHTECVLRARKAGTLPTYDEWRATQPRRPGLLARVLSLFVLALLAGCGSSSHSPTAAPSRPTFAYDASAPLHYVDRGPINRRGEKVSVHDVVFRSGGLPIEGFLVLPRAKGRHPAV